MFSSVATRGCLIRDRDCLRFYFFALLMLSWLVLCRVFICCNFWCYLCISNVLKGLVSQYYVSLVSFRFINLFDQLFSLLYFVVCWSHWEISSLTGFSKLSSTSQSDWNSLLGDLKKTKTKNHFIAGLIPTKETNWPQTRNYVCMHDFFYSAIKPLIQDFKNFQAIIRHTSNFPNRGSHFNTIHTELF